MHPLRLSQRVPSSMPLGPAELPGYALRFHKMGRDGSGKCNVLRTDHHAHRVVGIVYQLLAVEKHLLDEAEGLGFGYELETRTIPFRSDHCEVFFYVAQPGHIDDSLKPYHWYKDLVVMGARTHGVHQDYVDELERVAAISDPDEQRTHVHRQILHGGG